MGAGLSPTQYHSAPTAADYLFNWLLTAITIFEPAKRSLPVKILPWKPALPGFPDTRFRCFIIIQIYLHEASSTAAV